MGKRGTYTLLSEGISDTMFAALIASDEAAHWLASLLVYLVLG